MHNLTLAEIAAKFSRLDGIEDHDHAQYEKALRNLVQRQYLPMTTQQGRVFLYDNAAAVTIRLAQIAAEFGIPRASIDNLTRYLTNAGDRVKPVKGGHRGVSRAEEAIERVSSGEGFAIHVIMRADGTVVAKADWKSDRPADNPEDVSRVKEALRLAGLEPKPEIARFSLPASRLIAEVLPLLGKA